MKVIACIFIVLVFMGTSCSDTDESISGDNLFETNHNFTGFYSRYSYIDNKVDQINLISDNFDFVYLKVNYLNDSKLKSVSYNHDAPIFQQYDTLIYSSDNLIQIIKTTRKNGIVTKYDTSNFLYDQSNNLIQASNQSGRKVEFLEYSGNNFKRVKYYTDSQLQSDTNLKYDDKVSPFKGLGYLNIVIFNNNALEGLDHLTEHNITELTTDDYQSVIYTSTLKFKYTYDIKSRPTTVTTTRAGDDEWIIKEFYRYK